MEPTLPQPMGANPEVASNISGATGSQQIQSAEAAPSTQPEKPQENPQPAQVAQTPQLSSNPVPISPLPISSPDPTAVPTSTNTPLVADDVDVIEKEWVDKAKKIVSATKEDPHLQEKEVSKLQADYLMKRYNKQLKLTE